MWYNKVLFTCGRTLTNSLDPISRTPSKKPKRGPGRPRKHQQAPTTVKISDSDHSEHDEPNDEQGEDTENAGELGEQVKKTKRVYTIDQKCESWLTVGSILSRREANTSTYLGQRSTGGQLKGILNEIQLSKKLEDQSHIVLT